MVGVIFAKIKFSLISSENVFFGDGIFLARLGPVFEKKVLKL